MLQRLSAPMRLVTAPMLIIHMLIIHPSYSLSTKGLTKRPRMSRFTSAL